MLQHIKDLPPHVAGIHAVGKVTGEDYEKVLMPLFDEYLQTYKGINYLLVLETDVSNFTLAAWWRDFKIMVKYYRKWNKIAVVTDKSGVEWFIDVFMRVIPGQSKRFPLDKLDEAIKWVSGKNEL